MAKPKLSPTQRQILERFQIIEATAVPPLSTVETVCVGRKWTLETESTLDPQLTVTARITTEDGEVFDGEAYQVDVAGIKALCAALVATTEVQAEMFGDRDGVTTTVNGKSGAEAVEEIRRAARAAVDSLG